MVDSPKRLKSTPLDRQIAIKECIDAAGLQKDSKFVLKVIQFFETLNVRFGVMLVGPTGSGKTENYRMLQAAMTRLREEGHEDERYQVRSLVGQDQSDA
eukprot:7768949-Pyramimonas_sp.AAC.3